MKSQDYNVKCMEMVCACVCVHVCLHIYVCVHARVHACVIIPLRENRGMKNQENCINDGSELKEKGLITGITYIETSVCLSRDFNRVLAIFFFLWSSWLFCIAKPCPDYFFSKHLPAHPHKIKWSLPNKDKDKVKWSLPNKDKDKVNRY